MSRRPRTIAAASTALLLGLGGTLLAAAPASAASTDVITPGWEWIDVTDDALYIEDAFAQYADFHGVANIDGWAGDAFDGFLDTITLTYDGGAAVPVSLTPVSAVYNDNGLSTIVSEAEVDFGNGHVVDLTLTLRVEGAYSQWSFDFDDEGSDTLVDTIVNISGDLGSDDDTDFTNVGTNGQISTDGGSTDPVIGYHFTSGGEFAFTGVDGNERGGVQFDASDATYTAVLMDWDACSFDAAVAAVTALVPNLESTFGDESEPQYLTNCLEPAQSNSIVLDAPTSLAIPLTSSPGLLAYYGGPFTFQTAFTGSLFTGLPAGVTGSIVYNSGTNTSEIRLSGTPTQTGLYQVDVVGYYTGEGNDSPLLMTFPLTVGLPATGPADSAPAALVALALLGAGAATVFVTARSRRRSLAG